MSTATLVVSPSAYILRIFLDLQDRMNTVITLLPISYDLIRLDPKAIL